MDLSPRLRAVCDLDVAEMREYSGRHEYDGQPQDLSPEGVRTGLARLAAGAYPGTHPSLRSAKSTSLCRIPHWSSHIDLGESGAEVVAMHRMAGHQALL